MEGWRLYYCRIIFLNILKTALRAKTKLIVILVKTQLEIEDTIGEKIMQGIQNSSKLLHTKAWLSHTWYLLLISVMRVVEKKLSCGEISDSHSWQMWKNLKILHICPVRKCQISPHDRCGKIWKFSTWQMFLVFLWCVVAFYAAFLDKIVAKSVLLIYTRFLVEKMEPKIVPVEKKW